MEVPVAARSKTQVCCRSSAGTVCLNPFENYFTVIDTDLDAPGNRSETPGKF